MGTARGGGGGDRGAGRCSPPRRREAQETGGAPQLDPGALNRFYAGDRDRHWVTTTSVAAGYAYEPTLGFLLPSGGAGRHAVYGCLAGGEDHFLSLDGNCEGQLPLGRLGYAYASPPDGARDGRGLALPAAGHRPLRVARRRLRGPHDRGRGSASCRRAAPARALVRRRRDRHWVTAAPSRRAMTTRRRSATCWRPAATGGRRCTRAARAAPTSSSRPTRAARAGRRSAARAGSTRRPPTSEETVPLYRCTTRTTSRRRAPTARASQAEGLLGHLRARQPALHQYANRATGTNWVTTGAPGPGLPLPAHARVPGRDRRRDLHPIYACRSDSDDHFLSLDPGCEGRVVEGRAGFAFDEPPGAEETVALYRCVDPGARTSRRWTRTARAR